MSSDAERLEKLQKLLDFKRKVHTNPVEVGIDDLAWLIEKAAKQVYQQAELTFEPPTGKHPIENYPNATAWYLDNFEK